MKYYFIETQHLTDETFAQSIYAKDTFNEAVSAFHSSLAYAMQVETVQKTMCMVVGENGEVFKSEVWTRS